MSLKQFQIYSTSGYTGNFLGIDIFRCQFVHWHWLLLHQKQSYDTITRSKNSCATENQACYNKKNLDWYEDCKRMGLILPRRTYHIVYIIWTPHIMEHIIWAAYHMIWPLLYHIVYMEIITVSQIQLLIIISILKAVYMTD